MLICLLFFQLFLLLSVKIISFPLLKWLTRTGDHSENSGEQASFFHAIISLLFLEVIEITSKYLEDLESSSRKEAREVYQIYMLQIVANMFFQI